MPANGLRVNHYDFVALHLRSLVVRAVHRHRTGIGSIPAGGPYS